MTSDRPNAITSPVRFMARGLAEAVGDEKAEARFPSPLVGEGGIGACGRRLLERRCFTSAMTPDEGSLSAETTPHPSPTRGEGRKSETKRHACGRECEGNGGGGRKGGLGSRQAPADRPAIIQ